MPGNRRRGGNAVPIASFAAWILIGSFVCVAGLGYVWCKNQLYTNGALIKKLEVELGKLRSENEVAESKISTLSSMKMLNARYKDGFIDLVPITQAAIVQVSGNANPMDTSQLQAVANERAHE